MAKDLPRRAQRTDFWAVRVRTTLRALESAIDAQDADAFYIAIADCPEDEPGLCDLLARALVAHWHTRHEDVTLMIQKLRCHAAIDALEERALNRPDYLDWDDGYALGRKCTWALADIGTREARHSLHNLSQSSNDPVAAYAQRRLDRWSDELSRKR